MGECAFVYFQCLVDAQHIGRVLVVNTTLFRVARESLSLLGEEALESTLGAAVARTIGALLQQLRAVVDQDTVIFTGLVGVVLVAEAVALESFDTNVCQE